MTDTHWLAWAAGIIDGEGCIRLARKQRRHTSTWTVSVSVSNTDPRMLAKLQELFGGGVYGHERSNRPNRKPIWQWNLVCLKALSFLEAISPWLVAKREQAELAILSRRYSGSSRRRIPVDREALRWLDARLRELKREMPIGAAGQSGPPVARQGNERWDF